MNRIITLIIYYNYYSKNIKTTYREKEICYYISRKSTKLDLKKKKKTRLVFQQKNVVMRISHKRAIGLDVMSQN